MRYQGVDIVDKAKKQEFIMRMTQANRTQLIVVIYDVFLEYMKDAQEAVDRGNIPAFRQAISNAQPVISELISVLDFKYPIARELFRIYRYCNECLAAALISNDPARLDSAVKAIEKLRKAFYEISLKDDSPVLMQNSQKVYAGLTYGRSDVNETMEEQSTRGFFI